MEYDNVKILKTKVIDNVLKKNDGTYNIAAISIIVFLEYDEREYFLNYDIKESYCESPVFLSAINNENCEKLRIKFMTHKGLDSAAFFELQRQWEWFLKKIKILSKVEEIWEKYIDETYDRKGDSIFAKKIRQSEKPVQEKTSEEYAKECKKKSEQYKKEWREYNE